MTSTNPVATRVDTFDRAVEVAREDFSSFRIVLDYGWATTSGWVVVTHNPNIYPVAYRDEEDDMLLVAVDRDGAVTGGQYLTFMDAIDNGTRVGAWPAESAD